MFSFLFHLINALHILEFIRYIHIFSWFALQCILFFGLAEAWMSSYLLAFFYFITIFVLLHNIREANKLL